MTGTSIVQNIVGGFTSLLSGCASAIVDLFNVIFMNATTVDGVTTYDGLSNLGIWLLTFIGVGAAFGIIRAIRNMVV